MPSELLLSLRQLHAPASLSIEIWFARRAGCPEVFDGDTTFELRRERVRAHLREKGIEAATAGHKNGQPMTFAEVFASVYEEGE